MGNMKHGCVLGCFLIGILGCDPAPVVPPAEALVAPVAIGTAFDRVQVGSISGVVRWQGAIPTTAPFRAGGYFADGHIIPGPIIRENPNVPRVDHRTRAVQGAVVFLRGVDAKKSRPWDLPPVQVEMRDLRLHIRQGATDSSFGFVRQGDRVTAVSRDRAFHVLWLRGAAFCSIPLPDPDQPLERPLVQPGIVELSSGAGYPWMRAYLFVSDHPYYARTDERGQFQFDQVPPGKYEVVCWMPNWRIVDRARDPESAVVLRVRYASPMESTATVEVQTAASSRVQLTVAERAFH
jgi:hypothetical protein